MTIVVALLVGMLLGWAIRHTTAQLDALIDHASVDDAPYAWANRVQREIDALPEVKP